MIKKRRVFSERKKIKSILEKIPLEGDQSQIRERVHLCPRCAKELIKDQFTCPGCHLEFKSKEEGRRKSIIFPGGGYFYSGHFILGAMDAVVG